MLAYCRNNIFGKSVGFFKQDGFTLLEILVVMSLVGLLVSTVTPSIYKAVERKRVASERQLILAAIERIGYQSYLDGKPRQLTSSVEENTPEYPINLLSGWSLQISKPIEYLSTGICGGGEVSIIDPTGAIQNYSLSSPSCKPLLHDDSEQQKL